MQRAFWISYSALILLSAANWVQEPDTDLLPNPLPAASAHAEPEPPYEALPSPTSDLRPAVYQPPVEPSAPAVMTMPEPLSVLPWADVPCHSRTHEGLQSWRSSEPGSMQVAAVSSGISGLPGLGSRTEVASRGVARKRALPASQRMPGHPRASALDWR